MERALRVTPSLPMIKPCSLDAWRLGSPIAELDEAAEAAEAAPGAKSAKRMVMMLPAMDLEFSARRRLGRGAERARHDSGAGDLNALPPSSARRHESDGNVPRLANDFTTHVSE